MTLSFLDFDASTAADGSGNFDAMANVAISQHQALLAEVAAVLDWVDAQFPGLQAPLDEGGEWDYQLQCQQEWSADEGLTYDLSTRQFSTHTGPTSAPRYNLTLSISGGPQFCEAFEAQFLHADLTD